MSPQNFVPGGSHSPTRILRTGLLGQLDDKSRRVVLISGPIGSGKTALVNAYARNRSGVGRVDLSTRENVPGILRRAILAALGPPHLAPPTLQDSGEWITALHECRPVNEASRITCLILDGADQIIDSEAQQALGDLIEFGPQDLRLIVTTRHRWPSWLSRARATGSTTTIHACDLKLTETEVSTALGFPAPELDGWALGVQMYADLGPVEGEQAVRDYLRAEVVHRATTEVAQALFAIAVAGPASPAFTLHLTENPASGRLLSQFAANTQLATVADRSVVSLHPVLARHLQDELLMENWSDFVLYKKRAAAWYAERGRIDEAVRAYTELGMFEAAADCLLRQWQHAVLSGRCEQVFDALDLLPSLLIVGNPRLCVVKAMASLAAGDCAEWERWSDVALVQGHPESTVDDGVTLGAAMAAAARLKQALLDEELAPLVPGQLIGAWRAIDGVAVGLTRLWSGDLHGAALDFRHAEATSRASGDQLALAHALAGAALAAALRGDPAAVAAADEAIAVSDHLCPSSRWVAANAHLALAEIHLFAGNRESSSIAARGALATLAGSPDALEPRTRRRAAQICEMLDGSCHAPEMDRTGLVALSARERRVLRALFGPLTLREIAQELCVSHNTVKSQVNSIFRKLGVHDRAAAVEAARSRKLVRG